MIDLSDFPCNLSSIMLIRSAFRDAEANQMDLLIEDRGLWWEVEALYYNAPNVMIKTSIGVAIIRPSHGARFNVRLKDDSKGS